VFFLGFIGKIFFFNIYFVYYIGEKRFTNRIYLKIIFVQASFYNITKIQFLSKR
jgi:hypothetical protein